jgi:hypothetical protein
MISFEALLVFVGAASLPVIYLFICSRWIESESQRTRRESPVLESKISQPPHPEAAGLLIS